MWRVGGEHTGFSSALQGRVKRRGTRRGDSGAHVRRLQERLAEMGYEPGPADGRFGYLTEDALLAFQREYRLRIDGIAGPEVWNAIRGGLPKRRIVHVVRHSERLSEIADRYDMSVNALRWMNNLSGRRPLRPGDRLVIRSSYVLAGIANGASPRILERTLLAHRHRMTALAAPHVLVHADGHISFGESSEEKENFGALAREGGWTYYVTLAGTGEALADIMCRRKSRMRLCEELEKEVRGAHVGGLVVDLGSIPPGRGAKVAAGIARLADALGPRPVVPVLDVPAGGWRSFLYDPDYEGIARLVRHVVIGAHRWERLLDNRGQPPSREWLERSVAVMARRVPPWKLLLGVPMNAWALKRDGGGERLGYRAAVTEGYRYGIRPQKDVNGYFALNFPEQSKSGTARIVLPTRDVIGRYLALAHRFRLDGLYLSGIGEEDRRLWDVCAHRLKAVRGE